MSLKLAIKAFFKAFKEPEKTKQFLEEKKPIEKEEIDPSHLRLLSSLQRTGRFIDFLKEDISNYTDVQIGAAARKIHGECAKTLEELVTVRPLYPEKEGTSITIPQGYNPQEVKVIGQVKGAPPYKGRLVHKGWRAHKQSLPCESVDLDHKVISPAEVEVK